MSGRAIATLATERAELAATTIPKSLAMAVAAMLAFGVPLAAHNGPPFPVITDRFAGNYVISLWADPDASDQGDADGRFWVLVNPAAKGTPLPADLHVEISIWPVDRPRAIHSETATSDAHDASRRFAAFVIDHEGQYGVKATIASALGPAEVQTTVDAQYDQRPRPILIAVFALPFVLIGFVWLKLVFRRRANRIGTASRPSPTRGM